MNNVISGDTYKATYQDTTYSPSTATCRLFITGPNSINVAGVDNGEGGWLFTLSATQTALLTSGTYTYAYRVTVSGEIYTVSSGVIRVLPNPADTTPKVVFAEKMLQAIERVLEGQLSPAEAVAVQSFSVGGRSLTMLSREELMEERGKWIRSLNRMRNGGIGVKGRPVNINSILGSRL